MPSPCTDGLTALVPTRTSRPFWPLSARSQPPLCAEPCSSENLPIQKVPGTRHESCSAAGLAPGVDVARCRGVASRPAGWKLGGLPTADCCARCGGTRSAFGHGHRRPRRSRGRSRADQSGRWVVLHGVPLTATDSQRVAVIVEPAHPSRIAPLLMSAYGLTEREQQLTRLVLQGYSTLDIADHLVISAHTVQEHQERIHQNRSARPA